MARSLLVLIALLSTACTTTPSQPATQSRALPKLCLVPPTVRQACSLPDWYDKASPADKAAVELNCKTMDTVAILERDARLADCHAWFEAGK